MLDHSLGFENEEKLLELFNKSRQQIPQFKDFKAFNPVLFEGSFEKIPCIRKLKYIRTSDDNFQNGEVYESSHFNGSVYTVNGVVIGSAYFRWIMDDEVNQ